ncbi:MAG TPA: Flp family type IVb pilin [Caulobacteraceae bacterium]|jgi:pilus assembly protein Flp/PilA|nr:Flp family type IVb pilin [Caulobacteraceae bacterium]
MDRTPANDVVTALRALGRDRAGVTAVEYALIAGMIALAIITALALVGTNLTTFFTNLHTNLSTLG